MISKSVNIFPINRSEIEDRWDSIFYIRKKSIIGLEKLVLEKIGKHFFVKDGDHDKLPEEVISNSANGFRYLRAQDLKENQIISERPVWVNKQYFDSVPRCHIYPNDLLFSIMASVGATAVVPTDFPVCTANRAIGILRAKEKSIFIPEYVQIFLNTELGIKLLELQKRGGIQQRVNLEDISNLELPVFDLATQQKFVDYYKSALEQKHSKQKQANKLLASIDAYLLSELGIELPQEDNTLRKRIFKVSSSQLIGSRWDCSSNKNDFSLNSNKFTNVKLFDVVSINPSVYFPLNIEEITFIPMEAIDENYGEITNNYKKEVSESSGFTRFMQGDLIWAKITPCMQNGKSAVVRETINGYACGSTEFFVLRCNKNKIDVNYLFYIMHVKKLLEYATNFFGGNAGQQRVSKDFLLNLKIPLPPLDKQIDIASKLQEIQNKAKQLKNEADMILQEAKQKVERMILG